MGQGTWGLDDCGDGGYEAAADMKRQEFFDLLERKKAMRRKKKIQKDAIKLEVEKQLKRHGIEPKPYRPRGALVEVKCKCCKEPFMARVADRKRGWGKFCSKSCKATHQDKHTSMNRIFYGS